MKLRFVSVVYLCFFFVILFAQILLTVELRAAEDKEFLRLLSRNGFDWNVIDESFLDAAWSSEDIKTFVVKKRYGEEDVLYLS
jgi:hypothetical protein